MQCFAANDLPCLECHPTKFVVLSLSYIKLNIRPDFQLAFAPNYFHSERPIWKAIIQLNLIGYAVFVHPN